MQDSLGDSNQANLEHIHIAPLRLYLQLGRCFRPWAQCQTVSLKQGRRLVGITANQLELN